MNKTICKKCRHLKKIKRHFGSAQAILYRCLAPWQKTQSLLTGLHEPTYEICSDKNDGDCVHFEPTAVVRFWNWINQTLKRTS